MIKSIQLRGNKLLNAIEKKLIELSQNEEKYVYNASELAREIGCSRPTLNSKQEFIDSVLEKIGAAKRLKRDHPLLEQLYMRIEKLENEKRDLEISLDSLRLNHAQIFTRLLRHSTDMSVLIRPIAKNDSVISGSCILCNQKVEKEYEVSTKANVIDLSDRNSES